MTKAEERANEKYPLMQDGDKEGVEALEYIGMEFDSVYDYNSVRYSQQAYFIEGYQQAEKDLTLTWEDISIIRRIMYDYNKQIRNEMAIPKEEEYCKEILRRFLEQK